MIHKNKKIIILFLSIIMMITVPINAFASSGLNISIDENGLINIHTGQKDAFTSTWSDFIKRYKAFIVAISALGALTSVLLFIKAFLGLSTSGDHPIQRHNAKRALLWTGLSTALLGATGLITGITYGIFR